MDFFEVHFNVQVLLILAPMETNGSEMILELGAGYT